MPDNTQKNETGRRRKRKKRYAFLLLLLLALLFFALWYFLIKEKLPAARTLHGFLHVPTADLPDSADLASLEDTLSTTDTVTDATALKKTDGKDAPGHATVSRIQETGQEKTVEVEMPRIDPCDTDTVPPWVYPDPPGGLHRGHLEVKFVSDKECTIEWRFDDETSFKIYTGEPVPVTGDAAIVFLARDGCGNELAQRTARYKIDKPLEFNHCPENMEYIKSGDMEFCIDRYEWPNGPGQKPSSYVSIYQARDSCFVAGKRLCETEEWMLACGGPHGWNYPYGNDYLPRACNTQDTSVYASGRMAECRGYFEVYDMSGNLAEWTNTPSSRNPRFFNVMGGFWGSGPAAGCYDRRHSYFPQNRHNPVGFRCCKDPAADNKPQ